MSRSLKKAPFLNQDLFLDLFLSKISRSGYLSRSSIISPEFVGRTILIAGGKSSSNIVVSDPLVGKKFGEFVFSRNLKASKKKGRK